LFSAAVHSRDLKSHRKPDEGLRHRVWCGGQKQKSRIDRSIQRSQAGGFDRFVLYSELVGRMPVVATLAELSEDALVKIDRA
jgi:ATP-dependent protease Clp ATPase subunit